MLKASNDPTDPQVAKLEPLHPLKDNLQLKGKGKFRTVYDGTKPLPGITQPMKRSFFPRYEYETATLQTYYPPEVGSKAPAKAFKRWTKIRTGAKVGIKVDNLFELSFKLMRKYRLKPHAFFNLPCHKSLVKRALKLMKGCEEDEKAFKRAIKNFYVSSIHMKLHQNNLTAIGVQVPVRHNIINLGTTIDIVAQNNETKKRLPINVKSGHMYQHYHTRFRMSYPFGDKDDSQANQNQIQLAAEREMYRHTFPDQPLGQSYDLVVNKERSELLPLQAWSESRTAVMLASLRFG